MKLIGITGKAWAGKDKIAEYLVINHGFFSAAFAGPLKRACSIIFGVEEKFFHDRELKDKVIPEWGLSPRQMLQMVGNDAIKPVFGEYFWVKRWLCEYITVKPKGDTVVPDVRFHVEASQIKDLGGKIIEVRRSNLPEISGADHCSESGIDSHLVDFVVYNDGSFDELYEQIREVLEHG